MQSMLRALAGGVIAFYVLPGSLAPTASSQVLTLDAEPVIAISPDKKAALDAFAARTVRSGQVGNMTYGLWQRGALVQSGAYGPVQKGGDTSVSPDTIYQIYSMTKPVTALGMLILHERGYFDLDDPITAVLPEFEGIEVVADYDEDGRIFTYRPPGPPTFRQLLSHTAGFAYQSENRSLIDQKYIALGVATAPDGDALVSRMARVPLMRTPGAEWHYSFASDLQGVIIERLTGESLHEFLKREIFDRLNMQDTGFFVVKEDQHRVSSIATFSQGRLVHEPAGDLSRAAQRETYFEGGHGLVSTLADYHRFLDMLRRKGRVGGVQIVSPDSVDLMTHNAIRYQGEPAPQRGYGRGSGLGYGFGVSIVERPSIAGLSAPEGTYYWYGALGSWFWVDPKNEIVFVGMIQTRAPIGPDMLAASMEAVYGPVPGAGSSGVSPP